MASQHSVSTWIGRLKEGNPAAAQELWERSCRRLVQLARQKLRDWKPRGTDEEDVALKAFDSFVRAVKENRLPQLADSDNFWRILTTVTVRKVKALRVTAGRKKRLADFLVVPAEMEMLVDSKPTPEFAAAFLDELRFLMSKLSEPHGQIVKWKIEGYTNEEIAAMLNCSIRTVERKLGLIRKHLKSEDRP